MTDRVKGFTVTLEKDVRIDDVGLIMKAIQMIKGVVDVTPSITTSDDHMNRMVVRSELRNKFYKFIADEFK